MNNFGKLIKEHRIKNGLKGFELAKKIGVHQTYVTHIERNGKIPSLAILKKLESALNVDLHDAYIKESVPDELTIVKNIPHTTNLELTVKNALAKINKFKTKHPDLWESYVKIWNETAPKSSNK